MGTAFVNLQQDEHGVIAELSKANDGKEATEKAKFAFVVGADGAHSALSDLPIEHDLTRSTGLVRKALSIGFAGETRESGQLYIIDARIEGVKGGNVSFRFHCVACESSFCSRTFIIGETRRQKCA